VHGNPRQGFILSVLFHLVVAGAALLLAIIQPPEEKERVIFELVSAPPPMTEIMTEPSVDFSMPEVRPPPPPKTIPVPEPEPELPKPLPVVPVAKPLPKPKPAEEKKPEQPPSKTLSYEEFVKQHGAPRAPPPKKPAAPKPVNVPRLNTKFTANIPDVVIHLDRLDNLSDAELSALDRYIARLKEALRRAWDKPRALAESLATAVEFDVAPNGRLSGVRVTEGSGNRQFDESVTRAFTILGNAGATPDGKVQQLRLTFRMTDE